MTTVARCPECDWKEDFQDYSEAKQAAEDHVHKPVRIKEVEKE